jgi:hypothetical protein
METDHPNRVARLVQHSTTAPRLESTVAPTPLSPEPAGRVRRRKVIQYSRVRMNALNWPLILSRPVTTTNPVAQHFFAETKTDIENLVKSKRFHLHTVGKLEE